VSAGKEGEKFFASYTSPWFIAPGADYIGRNRGAYAILIQPRPKWLKLQNNIVPVAKYDVENQWCEVAQPDQAQITIARVALRTVTNSIVKPAAKDEDFAFRIGKVRTQPIAYIG
jgi:hypothetical protein